MRRAIIEGSEPVEKEQPIRYSLSQINPSFGEDGYVVLEATVGTLTQTLLILKPHTITKVGYVSNKIGLPTSQDTGSVIIKEHS